MHRFFQCQCWHSWISFKQFYDSRAFALKLLGQKRTQCHAQFLKYIPPFILHMSLRSRTCLSKFFTSVQRTEEIGSLGAFMLLWQTYVQISRRTCWVITDGLKDLVPEGAAVYGLTRAKGDASVGSKPLCGCALTSQAEALLLEISLVQMTEATALGVQKTASQY